MVDPHDWVKAKSVQKLKELQPQLFEKFVEFEQAVYEPRHLSTKIKELYPPRSRNSSLWQ